MSFLGLEGHFGGSLYTPSRGNGHTSVGTLGKVDVTTCKGVSQAVIIASSYVSTLLSGFLLW